MTKYKTLWVVGARYKGHVPVIRQGRRWIWLANDVTDRCGWVAIDGNHLEKFGWFAFKWYKPGYPDGTEFIAWRTKNEWLHRTTERTWSQLRTYFNATYTGQVGLTKLTSVLNVLGLKDP